MQLWDVFCRQKQCLLFNLNLGGKHPLLYLQDAFGIHWNVSGIEGIQSSVTDTPT